MIVHSNQHKLGDDMGNDPKSSSFYMAMCLSEGVLLILDGPASPFKRSWWYVLCGLQACLHFD